MREEFLSFLNNGKKDIFINSLDSDFTIVMGLLPSRDEKLLSNLQRNSNIVYLSVIEDKDMTHISKMQSRYEAGSEEGVLAILAKELFYDKKIDKITKNFFENMDDGYLSAESNIGEEELEEINEMYKNSKNPVLVLGYDFFNHPRRENIAKIIGIFVKYGNFKVYVDDSNLQIDKNYKNIDLEEVAELDSFDGTIVYTCPTNDNSEEEFLFGSPQFMVAAKVKDEDDIFVITQNTEYQRKFILDRELKGTVALLPSADGDESYYYKIAKIIKREN